MNVTMGDSSNYTAYKLTIEEFEYQEFLRDDILVVIFLICLCLVGTIGNGHAFVVYYVRYKPSNHRTFVVWLAAIDFVACAVSAPFEIVDIRHGYTFDSALACKIFRFINHVASIASGFMLGIIAVERYRKACCPFGRQISEREAAVACVVNVVFSVLLSTPSFYLYDSALKATDRPELVGKDCTVGADFSQKLTFRGYSFVLLMMSTLVFILCVFAYSFVGRSLYSQISFRKSAQTPLNKKISNNSVSSENIMSVSSLKPNRTKGNNNSKSNELHSIHEDESSVYLEKNKMLSTKIRNLKPIMKGKQKLDRTKRITLMFLIATAVSYVGYLPNLIILVIRAAQPQAYRNIAESLGMFTSVLLRGYFLSNVTNPLVYCFVDDRFRKECKILYMKMFQLSFDKQNSPDTITHRK